MQEFQDMFGLGPYQASGTSQSAVFRAIIAELESSIKLVAGRRGRW